MRRRYRNRAGSKLLLGGLMIAVLAALVALRKHGIPDGVVAVGAVALGVLGSIFYIQGCTALAEAKGYHGSTILAIIIFSYACFFPMMLFIPLIIFFGFKDRTSSR